MNGSGVHDADCPTCNPKAPDPHAIPIGEPGNRVCEMCGFHESGHPDLKWTQTPAIRHHLAGPEKGLLNICTECWDDLTRDLHGYIAERQAEIDDLHCRLEDAMKLAGIKTARIHREGKPRSAIK